MGKTTTKRATVRLGLDNSGFLRTLAATEKRATASGRRMSAALGKGVRAAAPRNGGGSEIAAYEKNMMRMISRLERAFARLNAKGGLVLGMKDINARSRSSARTVDRAFVTTHGGGKGDPYTLGAAARGAGKGIGLGKLAGGAAIGTMVADVVTSAAAKGIGLAFEANDTYEKANRISIGARNAGGSYEDPSRLFREFVDVTQEVKGVTADAAADATAKFVSLTGKLDVARANLNTFATASVASGTQMEDVASTIASLQEQFNLSDGEDVKDVLAALIYQGKAAAFELTDAASQYQKLAAAAGSFGVEKSIRGMRTLGGLTQIARAGTGSPQQATTAVESMFTAFKTKSADLKTAGVDVYKDGKVRDVTDVIVESIAKVGGNDIAKKNEGLAKIFGQYGIRALNPLINTYQTARGGASGTEEQKTAIAMKALRDRIEGAISAAGSWDDVLADSAQAQKTASAKFTSTIEALKGRLGEVLIPKLVEFADKLTPETLDAGIDALGEFADAMMQVVDFLRAANIIKGPSSEKIANQTRKMASREDSRIRGLTTERDEIMGDKNQTPAMKKRLETINAEIERRRKTRDAQLGYAEMLEKDAGIKKTVGAFGRMNSENYGETSSPILSGINMQKGADGKLIVSPGPVPSGTPATSAAAPPATPPPSIKTSGTQSVRIQDVIRAEITNPDAIGPKAGWQR
jgi:hypothetical protein